MRCQWPLHRVPQALEREGQEGQKGDQARELCQQSQGTPGSAVPWPWSGLPAAGTGTGRGAERQGGHPTALGIPCQQASVLWQHSRQNSNSETKDFLPPPVSHKFLRGSSRSHGSVFIKILVTLFNPPCKQKMENEAGLRSCVSVCHCCCGLPSRIG